MFCFYLAPLNHVVTAVVQPCVSSFRDPGSRTPEPAFRATPDKKADVDTDSTTERNPEDLAGRVCYELEPLVLS